MERGLSGSRLRGTLRRLAAARTSGRGSGKAGAGRTRTVRDFSVSGVWAFVLGAAVSLLVFALYLKTLAPGVLNYARPEMLDAAMLQVHAASLGITHPTGYPTWTMLTHLFTYLPVENVAYRTNLASAVYSTVAVALVYAAGYLLTRRAMAAAAGALAFGLGQTLWSQATIAEVLTLNATFAALLIALLLLWRDRRDDRYLLTACFFMGLSLTNHLTSGLLLPAGALFVLLTDRGKLRDARLALKGAGLFVLGLTPYAYLPIRASMDPQSMEADPSTPGALLDHVSGERLNERLLTLQPGHLWERLLFYGEQLLENLPLVVLVFAAVGLAAMVARDRAAAAFTAVIFAGWLTHAASYNILDVELYFIPTYLVVSLWVSTGVGTALDGAESLLSRRPRRLRLVLPAALGAAAVLLPLSGVVTTYPEVDRSGYDEGRRLIETVAREVEPGATVIHHRSSLWYMVVVEERRRDLTLVDPYYPSWGPRHYDAVWPGNLPPEQTNRRYGTSRDDLGVTAAKKAAEKGTVYILDHGRVGGSAFREAGFEIVSVERGMLYELVPRSQAL